MSYKDEAFQMVIDKSTMDALLCSDNPIVDVAMMLEEVYRVLKPDGYYLMVSFAAPAYRFEHFDRKHVKFQI